MYKKSASSQAIRNRLANHNRRDHPKLPDGWWLKHDGKESDRRYARCINARLDRRKLRRIKNGWHC